ncbi:MAG: helix-turn-helix transcriptional regulator [Kiritimatiellae bacterium]|nr:helix-turn-helix transcriptional regulator [Kiritimatiellia bacterium]
MELAQSLLKRPGIMLEAVAMFSGSKTYSVFRRHFIRMTGLSPRAWRKATAAQCPQ